MDESQAEVIEEALREHVASAGLQWVLDQVDEVALEGKPEFRKVGRESLKDAAELVPPELTRKRGVLASKPYTAQERLVLLLDAVRRALVEPVALREETTRLLLRDNRATTIRWVDGIDREPVRDAEDIRAAEEAARSSRGRLVEVLDELRERAAH